MPDFAFESRHMGLVAGVDEAGRGPLAGPVVAAAVILHRDDCPAGLDDSKKLTQARRAVLEAEIQRRAVCFGVGMCSVEEIDTLNILQATMLAMTRAVEALGRDCAHILVDGDRLPRWHWPATAVVGGDAYSLSIAAASILAKEARDRIMIAANEEHPGYGWAQNKGYSTARHLEALKRLGPSPLHRRSFAPVAQALLL